MELANKDCLLLDARAAYEEEEIGYFKSHSGEGILGLCPRTDEER